MTDPEGRPLSVARIRRRLYQVLEAGRSGDPASAVFDAAMTLLIMANVAAFSLQTVPSIDARYGARLDLFDTVSVAIFTIEYLLRIWVCTEHGPYHRLPAWRARLRFMRTPMMIIDLLAVAPFYLAFLVPVDLRVLRVFRLVRFLKLARYSPALTSLMQVVWTERRALGAALVIVAGALLVSSTLLYYIERHVQPEAFGSVPAAMWWAMATLTTVGYGDVVPVTVAGRIVGGLVMLFGLGMFALPIGIIATGFSQEIHRREFAVTWGMVARVPLFAELDADEIADVMRQLHAIQLPAGALLARAGEPADGMYFVVSGEVEVHVPGGPVVLREGDFFGEVALLGETPRNYDITVRRPAKLLKLASDDFASLCLRNPAILEKVREVAARRRAELVALTEAEESAAAKEIGTEDPQAGDQAD